MQPDKNSKQEDEQKQKVKNKGINLDDYAGDEQDDKSAREQSNNYMKDLDRTLNEQMGGNDSSVTSRPNEQ